MDNTPQQPPQQSNPSTNGTDLSVSTAPQQVGTSLTDSDSSASGLNTPSTIQGGGYISSHQPMPQKDKKSLRKIVGLGACIIVALALLLGAYAYYHHPVKQSPVAKPTVIKKHTPSITTSAAASLGLGTFKVGDDADIVPGLYSLSPGPQEKGDVLITSATGKYTATLNALEATDPTLDGTATAWVQLAAGDTVQLSGANLKDVTFRAVVTAPGESPALTKLYTDSFTVTTAAHKVNPGKYLLYDTTDKGAFIMIISSDYHIKYNQTLDSTGFVADLAVGDQVATLNFTQLYMKPVN